MIVAKTVEVTASSDKDFDDAIRRGLESAHREHGKIRGVWITDRSVLAQADATAQFRVKMSVSFLTQGSPPPSA